MIFSPAEFTIASGTKQSIRLTISVPEGTRSGDYYTAVYIEDRNPPPPPKENNPQLNIRYRFYSLIYVMVPDLTRNGEIADLLASTEDGRPIVKATLKNSGNSHVRGIHSVEIRDEADKVVAEIPKKEASVLLGESQLTTKLKLDKTLPAGKYTVAYTVDFGKGHSIQVGKTKLEVTAADVELAEKSKPVTPAPSAGPDSSGSGAKAAEPSGTSISKKEQ
jgi:hypothetical protein